MEWLLGAWGKTRWPTVHEMEMPELLYRVSRKGSNLREIRKLECIYYVRPENQLTELLRKLPFSEKMPFSEAPRNVLVRGVPAILRISVVAVLCKPT